MPRNVAVNDLRTYQMENPSTPDDFKVICGINSGVCPAQEINATSKEKVAKIVFIMIDLLAVHLSQRMVQKRFSFLITITR